MRRILAVSLLLAGALTGCEFEPTGSTGSGRPDEASFAKRPKASANTPHTIQFSTDITSAPVVASLSPANPFANLVSPSTPIVLPVSPDLVGCGATGGNWSPYEGSWTGYLTIEGGSSSANLTFWSSDAFGVPFVLAVDAATTTQKVGTSTVLTFSNAKMVAKQDKFPLVVIQPCATFSITATPL